MCKDFLALLGHFEDSQESESSECRQPKTASSFMKINPEHFKDGSGDDNGVEPVERGGEECHWAQGVHSNEHFKDEGTKEHELDVN